MDSKEQQLEKKPYSSPQVYEYGDVRELTRASSNPGAVQDGPGKGNVKTQ